MTRGLFLTQYKGEWAPSDDLWLGMDFLYAGGVFRFQTDAMYETHNLILEDGREARFYMYKQNKVMDSVKYDMIRSHPSGSRKAGESGQGFLDPLQLRLIYTVDN